MAKSRSANYDYRQTVLADCGHVTRAWPQFHQLGEQTYEVMCQECTRIRYEMPAHNVDPEDLIYVTVSPPEPKPKKKAAKAVSIRCSICQGKGHRYDSCPLLVGQGTLFDG